MFKWCFFVFTAFISLVNANEEGISPNELERILLHASKSIDRIDQDKIYFKPEKLSFFQGKIYVEVESGEGLFIPCLFSTDDGLYIKSNGSRIFNLWQCSFCQYWNHNDSNVCQKCLRLRTEN